MLSYKTVLLALLFSSSSLALPIRREVPQGMLLQRIHRKHLTRSPTEHSHQAILTAVQTTLATNNPDGIVDAVFGLLGNAAAAEGLGKLTDANCLQQATADQAFTNAKTAGDVDGQVSALIYRALERNSGTVVGTTTPCTTLQAVNPEIAAIQQHQVSVYLKFLLYVHLHGVVLRTLLPPTPLQLTRLLSLSSPSRSRLLVGIPRTPSSRVHSHLATPTVCRFNQDNSVSSRTSGSDSTGKGNTCDDANDAIGCIVSQNLLVPGLSRLPIMARKSLTPYQMPPLTRSTLLSLVSPPPPLPPPPLLALSVFHLFLHLL